MKQDKLIDAIGEIKDEYIEEAHSSAKKKLQFDWVWARRIALAGLCVLIVATALPRFLGMGGSAKSADAVYEASYDSEMVGAAPRSEESSYSYAANESKGISGQNSVLTQNKKLIVNASMSMETFDLDEVCKKLASDIENVGGYVQSSSIYNYGTRRTYEATIRIPADKFGGFIEGVKTSGNVTHYNEEVTDVTEAYSDLEARIRSLKAEEETVLEFYKKAESIDELMSVESRLTEIRYEIDSKETMLKNYDLLTSYSTLTITISETKQYTETSESFFTRIGNAFKNGFSNFIHSLEDVLIGITYNIWTIAFLALVTFVAYKVVKAIRNKRNKK